MTSRCASRTTGGHCSLHRRETKAQGKADLYVSTRASRQEPWGRAVNLGPPLNTDAFEAFPTPSADGRTLYFNRSTSFDSDDSDLWVSTRTGSDAPWDEPRRLGGAHASTASTCTWHASNVVEPGMLFVSSRLAGASPFRARPPDRAARVRLRAWRDPTARLCGGPVLRTDLRTGAG